MRLLSFLLEEGVLRGVSALGRWGRVQIGSRSNFLLVWEAFGPLSKGLALMEAAQIDRRARLISSRPRKILIMRILIFNS